jgi:hypothetical protein
LAAAGRGGRSLPRGCVGHKTQNPYRCLWQVGNIPHIQLADVTGMDAGGGMTYNGEVGR